MSWGLGGALGKRKQEAVSRQEVDEDACSDNQSSRGKRAAAAPRQRSARRALVLERPSTGVHRSTGSSIASGEVAPEAPLPAQPQVLFLHESAASVSSEVPQQQPSVPAVVFQSHTSHDIGSSTATASETASGAEGPKSATELPPLSSLAVEVAAEELEEVIAQAARDPPALLRSVRNAVSLAHVYPITPNVRKRIATWNSNQIWHRNCRVPS